MSLDSPLTDYDLRQSKFAHNRALILTFIHAEPGLTYEEVGKRFLLRHGFLPTVGNRIRELRKLGFVVTRMGEDHRLHVYPAGDMNE